jgi:hypothetical protein
MGKERSVNSVQINDEAMMAVEKVIATYGVRITKKDVVECVVIWLSQQSDVVQGSILGLLPPSQRVDIARRELERMAGSEKVRQAKK